MGSHKRRIRAPKRIDFRPKNSPRYKEPQWEKKVRRIFAEVDKKIQEVLG